MRYCVNKWGRRKHPELEIVDWKVPRKPRTEKKDAKRGSRKSPAFLQQWPSTLHDRAQAQATVALCTGLRAEELRRVQPQWVERINDKRIRYVLRLPGVATKNAHPRSVGLPASIAALIKRHFPIAEDFKQHFAAAAKRLGHGDTVTLRDLRHTFKVEVSRREYLAIQLVMGHRRIQAHSGDEYQHLLDKDCVRVALAARNLFLTNSSAAAES